MNRLISEIVTISVFLFAVCLILDFSFGSYFVCMLLPIGYIMISAGFQHESVQGSKVVANIGMTFSSSYAALLFLMYFAQATSVRLRNLSEQAMGILDFQRGGLVFNYDLLGYGIIARKHK